MNKINHSTNILAGYLNKSRLKAKLARKQRANFGAMLLENSLELCIIMISILL